MSTSYNNLGKIDLHIHSCYSDGALTPAEIVERWMAAGYTTIAITDHDGIEGSRIGQEFCLDKDINFVPGIEFDSECELGEKLHILGYNIDYEAPALKQSLNQVRTWRDERNAKLIAAINDMGYELTVDEVNRLNAGRYIGKPTIAKALINRGYVDNVPDAFSKIIDNTKSDYGKKKTLLSKKVVDVIHEADGTAVLAHPMEQKKNGESWEEFKPRLLKLLDAFVEYGIDGIEVYHPSASEEQSEFLLNYAKEHELIITKGSDFHSEGRQRDYSKYHK